MSVQRCSTDQPSNTEKIDGETRVGASISVQTVSGSPMKFIVVGEKVEKLAAFYTGRMAPQILVVGDMVTMAERRFKHKSKWMKQKRENVNENHGTSRP